MTLRLTLLLALLCAGCLSDADGATEALEAAGYSEITTHGFSAWGCAEDDNVTTKFVATSPGGQRVRGAVCRGLFFKGATIRITGDAPAPEGGA